MPEAKNAEAEKRVKRIHCAAREHGEGGRSISEVEWAGPRVTAARGTPRVGKRRQGQSSSSRSNRRSSSISPDVSTVPS